VRRFREVWVNYKLMTPCAARVHITQLLGERKRRLVTVRRWTRSGSFFSFLSRNFTLEVFGCLTIYSNDGRNTEGVSLWHLRSNTKTTDFVTGGSYYATAADFTEFGDSFLFRLLIRSTCFVRALGKVVFGFLMCVLGAWRQHACSTHVASLDGNAAPYI
jgi:hypothetical protein